MTQVKIRTPELDQVFKAENGFSYVPFKWRETVWHPEQKEFYAVVISTYDGKIYTLSLKDLQVI